MNPFEIWLTEKYGDGNTARGYAQDVGQFCAAMDVPSVEELTAAEARAWLGQFSGSTHNRKLAALKAWALWAVEVGTLREAPVARLNYLSVERGGVKWLDTKTAGRVEAWGEKLVNAATSDFARRTAVRNMAIVCVLRFAGLRVSEAADLDLADVMLRPRTGEVTVRHGKGNKRRTIPIEHKELIYWLTRWLEVRPVSESAALFISKRGVRLTRDGIAEAVEEIGRLAEVHLTPHILRHTFAKNLYDACKDRRIVQKMLGHSRAETTEIYTEPGEGEIRAALGRM